MGNSHVAEWGSEYSALLRLALVPGLLALSIQPALAKTWYADADGRRQASPVIAALLAGPRTAMLNGSGANKGWHVCDRRLAYARPVTVEGEVNLILGNRCDMHVTGRGDEAGIRILGANSRLTIWAQSADSAGPSVKGRLTAKGGERSAGIGGGADGAVVINGGTVNANGGYTSGAGIGPIEKPADAAVAAGGSATFGIAVATAGTDTANSTQAAYPWLESPDGGKSWPPGKQRSNPGLAYQWQRSTDGGENWSAIAGATKAALSVPGATADMHGYLYRCEVTVSQQVGHYSRKTFIVYTTGSGRLEVK